MKVFTCAATRRRLESYHDDELSVGDQISVGSHLEWCDPCAAAFQELRLVRAAVRVSSVERNGLSRDEAASFQRAVVSRVKAEQTMSASAQLRAMFDDMHFVYAGAGAALAALVCVVVTLAMLRFAVTIARPDSLAAIVNLLSSPGSDLNPVPVDARVLMPRALDEAFPINLGGDAVFTLSAVVTREGRIANLELLHAFRGQRDTQEVEQAIETVMGAMSRARFEPARVDGLPVAVNMVWLVAHTTVRGNARRLPQPIARVGKKLITNTDVASAGRALV